MKPINVLFALISPIWTFIFNFKKTFESKVGYIVFVLVGIQFNLCQKMRDIDDISRYIGNYKYYLEHEGNLILNDFYYVFTLNWFSSLSLPPITIYLFWSVVFYTGVYLCAMKVYQHTQNNFISMFVFFCSLISINFWEFTIMRFYTGAALLIYVILYLAPQRINYKYLLLIVAPIFHFALVFPAIGFVLYKAMNLGTKPLFLISVGSIIIQFFPVGYFDGVIHVDDYYDHFLTLNRNMDILRGSGIGRFFYLPLCICFIVEIWRLYNLKYLFKDDQDILKLGLYCISMFNIVSITQEFTSRYKHMFIILCAFVVLYYWKNYNIKPRKNFNIILPLSLILFDIDILLIGYDIIDMVTLFFTPLINAFNECLTAIEKVPVWM